MEVDRSARRRLRVRQLAVAWRPDRATTNSSRGVLRLRRAAGGPRKRYPSPAITAHGALVSSRARRLSQTISETVSGDSPTASATSRLVTPTIRPPMQSRKCWDRGAGFAAAPHGSCRPHDAVSEVAISPHHELSARRLRRRTHHGPPRSARGSAAYRAATRGRERLRDALLATPAAAVLATAKRRAGSTHAGRGAPPGGALEAPRSADGDLSAPVRPRSPCRAGPGCRAPTSGVRPRWRIALGRRRAAGTASGVCSWSSP